MGNLRRWLLLSALLLAGTFPAAAQFYPVEYRPPGLNWQELNTTHFRIVYPAGSDSAALAAGRLLESQYQSVQSLVGGELHNFPVVLRTYNDRSNGFVTSLHFRSEIDLVPQAGKSLNPRSGSWLEVVAPHELVHAMQYSNLGDFSLPAIVSIFSPDLARSFHGAIPSGINEGIAVYHESTGIYGGGGRGNLPYFTGRYRSLVDTPQRWSMGQMVHFPASMRPFDRHYIGGYEFTSWLHAEYGEILTRRALDFYVKYPFLGYGFALRHATGSWPSRLHDRFESAYDDSLQSSGGSEFAAAEASAATSAIEGRRLLEGISFNGISARHPLWADDSTLVFHASYYNARTGFYRYGVEDSRLDLLHATGSVSDYHFDLSASGDSLIYAFYRASATYDNAFRADLATFNIKSGRGHGLSRRQRLFSPIFAGGDILALQNNGTSSRLVSYTPDNGEVDVLLDVAPGRVVDVGVNPRDPSRIAVVINRRGVQGLWVVDRANLPGPLPTGPDVAFSDGSVYDPEWHPLQDILLFSSDRSGTLQLYEYHLSGGDGTGEVHQLTRNSQNTFEGSYSPSGDRIAYVTQYRNEQYPAVMERPAGERFQLPGPAWNFASGRPLADHMDRPPKGADADTADWEQENYRTGLGWLRPRIMLPIYNEISNRGIHESGISFQSSDLLQQHSYGLDITGVQDRFWYDFTYRNAMFFPGFEASISSTPSYRDFRFMTQQDTVQRTMLRQQRSFSLSLPFRWVLEDNLFFSSLILRPELVQSQTRYYELAHTGDPSSEFGNITIARLFAALNYRLQQNTRDIQPNSGLVFYGQLEHYLNDETIILHTLDNQFLRDFTTPSAFRAGMITWLSPLRRLNQSLRLEAQFLTQSGPVFDTQSVVSNAFLDPVFPIANNLVSLESRYTIPLFYPDEGGFLLPLYLENIYLAAFSDTVLDPMSGGLSTSQYVMGLELHSRFRLSNLSLDIGVGFGYEPSTDRFGLVFSLF